MCWLTIFAVSQLNFTKPVQSIHQHNSQENLVLFNDSLHLGFLRNCRDTEHYYSMVTVTNTNKPVNEIISALDVFCLYSVNFNSVSIIF